jgi:hypothetical protein
LKMSAIARPRKKTPANRKQIAFVDASKKLDHPNVPYGRPPTGESADSLKFEEEFLFVIGANEFRRIRDKHQSTTA